MREVVKPGIVLLTITVVASLLLGVVNGLTSGVIEDNKLKAMNEAMGKVFPGVDGVSFSDSVTTGNETGVTSVNPCFVENINNALPFGYAIFVTTSGYGGNIELLVGIDNTGVVRGIEIISHSETPGLGANADSSKFTGLFANKSGLYNVTKSAPQNDNDIQAMTSATITTQAVVDGVNEAVTYFNEHYFLAPTEGGE